MRVTPGKRRAPIPPPAPDTVRIIPLGGVEEIGRNMNVIEFGDDIIVVDCGFQFREEDTPGIDYILPNTQYLEERRDKIRGVIITHGHLDHIGGIPYIIDRIGNPPIYTRQLTSLLIKRRQEEFSHLPAIDIREVENDDVIRLGSLSVRFFAVTHTVPDSMGVIIETPYGDVVVTGDIKLDQKDGKPTEEEEREFGIFKNRNVLALLMDSTNVDRPGFSIPERTVFETLEEIIKRTQRRLIIGTFASQLERLMKIVQLAEKYGRKIVIEGRSMKTNIDIVRELGILKNKEETIISSESMGEYPPEKIIVLATGAQGDEYAALMRMANKTHRFLRATPKDTVVLSSSVIPGNERSVQKLLDNISRQGAHILTYQTSDVHASGHGNRDEAVWIHQQIRPKFFIPVHGYHYKLRVHADLVQESIQLPEDHTIIPNNGTIIEVQDGGKKFVRLKQEAPNEIRVVEGQSISELAGVLMRDRKALSQEGFCVVVATVDKRTGKLHKSPDIISRGFVYLRDNKDLMDQTRLIIRKNVEDSLRRPRGGDLEEARSNLADSVSHFLLQKTQKRPIVIPVIVSV
jgi:ribonuclease J